MLFRSTHYQNEKLEEIMQGYMKNQREAALHFEKRKKDMMAKPIEGSDTPFIEPGDENSKFYTKPDVPPIPHPADFLDELKKEHPDKTIDEIVAMADLRVAAEVLKRKEADEAERAAQETIPEGDESSA